MNYWMNAVQIIKSPETLTSLLFRLKQNAKRIGFVPTMGYLHAGHLSLVKRSNQENDVTVASIFVNPAQFGPKEDFKNYPRNVKRDLQMLRKAKVDYVFLPSTSSIYPSGFHAYLKAGFLARPLCGLKRPEHFDGVATVVKRLFDITIPDNAYFGQKDYQQFRIIEELPERFYLPVRAVLCPTVREKDGLAMSSRNSYLTSDERIRARALSQSLKHVKALIQRGARNPNTIKREMKKLLKPAVDRIDYIEVVDGKSLKRTAHLKGRVLIAVACFLGKARLIDNILIHV